MQTLRKERRYETLSYLPPLSDQQIAKQVQYILDQGYWTMWKLPLFNAGSVQEVLQEVNECRNAYRDSYVRVVGFDNIKQCQVLSFIIHKPGGGNNYRY
jgi:ribulose-bisphosphate carboxylase small chain